MTLYNITMYPQQKHITQKTIIIIMKQKRHKMKRSSWTFRSQSETFS